VGQVLGSEPFKALLALVLSVGNTLNYGSARVCDEGVGFKLQVRLNPLVLQNGSVGAAYKAADQ
jgi:hypothetical protein